MKVLYNGPEEARHIIRQTEFFYQEDKKKTLLKFTVLLVSYETVMADTTYLKRINWELLVVDEGKRVR